MSEVTYVCGQTNQKVVSSDGLPPGWVVPIRDISRDIDKPVPERYTVIAFSSEEALRTYSNTLLQTSMMTSG